MKENIFLCFLGAICMFYFFTGCGCAPLKSGKSLEPEKVPFKPYQKSAAKRSYEPGKA
jgi:hypothetical protein